MGVKRNGASVCPPAPNHLTEHASQIDAIFNDDVPNMSHNENMKVKVNW